MSKRGLPVTKEMRAARRASAEARQAEYDKLTIQQKLDRLPPPPQAARQRAKLLKQLEASKAHKHPSPEEMNVAPKEVSKKNKETLKAMKKGSNQ